MDTKVKHLFGLGSILVFMYIVLGAGSISAQPPAEILVCIIPDKIPSRPYLIPFRDTSSFGLIFPENASVTFYSQIKFSASVYSITTDALTGGYRPLDHIATVIAGSNYKIPPSDDNNRRPCSNFTELNDNMLLTHPIQVSPDRAVALTTGNILNITTPTFRGIFAFYFPMPALASMNLQVIQIDETTIELQLPIDFPNTTFILIANKPVNIVKYFESGTSSPVSINNRSSLSDQLKLESESYDLFEIMAEANFRIYPVGGLIDTTYRPRQYIRLENMSNEAPSRSFNQGDLVRPLDGTQANYYPVDSKAQLPEEAIGTLRIPTSTAEVMGVDENGQLRITGVSVPGGEAIIQAWLVDIFTPE